MSSTRERLEELLAKHQSNLHVLQVQAAQFTSGDRPLHLHHAIEAEEKALERINNQLRTTTHPSATNDADLSLKLDNNADKTDAITTVLDTANHRWQWGLMALCLILGLSGGFALGWWLKSNQLTVNPNVVIDERFDTGNPITAFHPNSIGASKIVEGYDGNGLEIHVENENIFYASRDLPLPGRRGETFTAEVLCKAPKGQFCQLLIFDRDNDDETDFEQSSRAKKIQGTGDWIKVIDTIKLTHDEERLAVYLYANLDIPNPPVLYDNLIVTRLDH